jgi:hypothetical protein
MGTGNQPRKVVIRAGARTTATLKLKGPATLDQARDLAAELNALVAKYNTLFFMDPNGGLAEPRISSDTN